MEIKSLINLQSSSEFICLVLFFKSIVTTAATFSVCCSSEKLFGDKLTGS